MSYNYQKQRASVFTEDGQKMFLAIRDTVGRHIAAAGAVRLDKAIAGQAGDSWDMLACVDRLVELGEIVEITDGTGDGLRRVFTR